MKVTQEKLPNSQIGLEIEIPAEISQNTYEKVVQNLARSTNLPGFRKGKIPRQILIQRLGSTRIKAAALEEIIQKTLEEAIAQEAITSLGNYQLRSDFEELVKDFQPGSPLVFSASVEVPPTVELGDYQSLEVSAQEKVYDPQEVEKWLQEKQEEQANLIPVEERQAQMGDVAIVDYKGRYTEGGEAIPGVEGSYLRVDMSPGRFIEGMVEGIVGMALDESRDLPLVFPPDYPMENVAGQAVTFSITLKELKEKQLPELDDDFAQELGEYETLEELKASLEERFREEAEKITKENIEAAILKELLATSQVDLPNSLIESEITQILQQTVGQMQQLGMDIQSVFTQENLPELRSNARPQAIEQLNQRLILDKIAEKEAIVVEEAEIAAKVAEVAVQLAGQQIDLDKLHTLVREGLMREKTVAWLTERVKIKPVPTTEAASEEE